MAFSSRQLTLISLAIASALLLLTPQTLAQSTAAAPSPSGPANLTGILDKNGQYTTFIRLLEETQVANQIENQLNSSTEGMTVMAPTDNAFNNLKAGTLNSLTTQQQVELVLYHVMPKYYSFAMLQTVSNPFQTQATGQDGSVFGLNFTSVAGQTNQVNVTTGVVETEINNALYQTFPLAVYQVDKVLLPEELFGNRTSTSSPPPSPSPIASSASNSSSKAASPTSSDNNNAASGGRNFGLGMVVGVVLSSCLGLLF
ncbi:FAS1 domain [Dillenia turbinata]|uniref:FAS1 domain n=1 Tax=Dillenia turbinata TaxID=194707 RepID=A0AAN8V284_9MAGN